MATEKQVPLQAFVAPELRQALKSAAQNRDIPVSEFVRETLKEALQRQAEEPLGSKLDKILKRIDAVISIQKSIEDDEVKRRVQERKAYLEVTAENMAQIGQVIAANSAAIQELAQRQDDLRVYLETEIGKVNSRVHTLAKQTTAMVLGTTDRGIREAYRAVESGEASGKKLRDFHLDAVKKA